MSSLLTQNPWWENPENIETETSIIKFEESRIKWTPRIRHYIKLDTEAIYTLRGPRQVGKTTLIKLIIRRLLRKGVNGRRIFYYSCDLVDNPSRLVNIIKTYLDATDYITEHYRYIFLDEISAVKNWQRGIKYLYDLGQLKKTSILMTGSHSLDLRKASERLPGRRGTGSNTLDKILLPMKFAEYVETRDKEMNRMLEESGLRRFDRRKQIIEKLVKSEIPSELKQLSLYLEKLNRYLDDYLLTGGVARAVNDYLEYGEITENTYRTYVDVTIGDFLRYNNDEIYLAQILRAINDTLCSQVSWRNLEKKTDIGSPNTVAKYIDVLKAGFVINPFYVVNRDKGTPDYSSNKKIHYADPFIFHALNGWINQTPAYSHSKNYIRENKSKLVEAVIGDHLIRYAYSLNPSDNFEPILNVFYWKDKKNEVDFIVKDGNEYLPFEVKFSESFSSDDINGLYNFTKYGTENSGIVVTKEHLSIEHNITSIPAAILLLLT
jgi:predicted AAA+ superfamily ATPase